MRNIGLWNKKWMKMDQLEFKKKKRPIYGLKAGCHHQQKFRTTNLNIYWKKKKSQKYDLASLWCLTQNPHKTMCSLVKSLH